MLSKIQVLKEKLTMCLKLSVVAFEIRDKVHIFSGL